MKETRIIMGMPITVELVDGSLAALEKVFQYFVAVDERFSTYKQESEMTKINRGSIKPAEYSSDMKEVFALSEETKKETDGYFDIRLAQGVRTPATKGDKEQAGPQYDPSGLVKGWAIHKAAGILHQLGVKNFCVEAGGDIQVSGKNAEGKEWAVGIRDPFDPHRQKVVKVLHATDEGVATSGTYVRGQHIYDPKNPHEPITDIVSLTVVGPNIYEADRFATAAFAMGRKGIEFIERRNGLEGYMIDKNGIATMTSGFGRYVKKV